MNKRNRGYLSFGLLLILLGVFALVQQLNPGLLSGIRFFDFPMIFLTLGGVLLLIGLVTWNLDLIPAAAVISSIWAIIYVQTRFNLPSSSWGYLWTLFPMAGGAGNVIAGLLNLRWQKAIEGIDSILFGVIAFVVIAYFMGGLSFLPPYAPAIALIGAGVYVLLRGFFKSLKRNQTISAR